ncbi:hypothetical protein [Neobacillus endophyticus]|nr:hypothetical protein [Neobacillus endophyticus]
MIVRLAELIVDLPPDSVNDVFLLSIELSISNSGNYRLHRL